MPSTKISALTSATAPGVNDLHVLAIGSTNKKITTGVLFHETLTRSAFLTKVSGSSLIAGRWYRVTGCGVTNNLTALVLATQANKYAREMYLDHATYGAVPASWVDLTQFPNVLREADGNEYRNYYDIDGTFPALNTGNYFHNCVFDARTGLTLSGVDSCEIAATFFQGIFNLQDTVGVNNVFFQSTVDNSEGGTLNLTNCHFNTSTFSKSEADVSITNVELDNATLIIQGTDNVYISNCRFSNCIVYIKNGAVVDSLTINGKPTTSLSMTTTYEIDGAQQSWVLDNWAGIVEADYRGENPLATTGGRSTVRAILRESPTAGEPGWDRNAGRITLFPSASVVGQYYLDTPSNGNNTWTFDEVLSSADHTQHAIEIRWRGYSGNTVKFNFYDYTNGPNPLQIFKYHGVTNKVGELKQVVDYVRLYSNYNTPNGDPCWQLVWGAHHD